MGATDLDDEESVRVQCRLVGTGWQCHVALDEAARTYEYDVSVSRAELDRFARGAFDPMRLVAQSFRFLLEREGPESILASFSVSDIERYFPEYGREISARLSQS
jgi:hypothetical protein